MRSARWTFAAAGAGTAVVMAVTASGAMRLQDEVRSSERVSQHLLATRPADPMPAMEPASAAVGVARHREVSTVFVSEISGGAGVIAPGKN
jgi:hypothetical protein